MLKHAIQHLVPNHFENKTLAMAELTERTENKDTQVKTFADFLKQKKYFEKHTLNPLILTAFSYEYYYQ